MTTPTINNLALAADIEAFKEAAKANNLADYYIGIDIGGTNTRVNAGFVKGRIYEFTKFTASDVHTLYAGLLAAETILRSIYVDKAPLACCIDIAGPTTSKDDYHITNYSHVNHGNVIQRKMLPQLICPKDSTFFLNDLESGCYGLVALIKNNLEGEYFCKMVERQQEKIPGSQVYVILAAGTGLGAGLIHHIDSHDKYFVIPTELGHLSIKPFGPNHPSFEKEMKFLKSIEPNYEKKPNIEKKRMFSLEYEDIVSGRGLVDCYNYFKSDSDKAIDNSGDIATTAISLVQNNPKFDIESNPCTMAMMTHYRYLLREAQELAVGLRATDVYLIGDNMVNNDPFVRCVKNELITEFYDHPKLHWLQKVTSVHVQSKKENLNLLGTIYYARTVLDQ